MEPNNFEKNIQEKLDEFKIPPSDFVWDNVEKRIGNHKSRRGAFLLFFLLLCLITGGYWLVNSGKNKGQHQSRQTGHVAKKENYMATLKKPDSSSNLSLFSSRVISGEKKQSSYQTKKIEKETSLEKGIVQNKSARSAMNHRRKKIAEKTAFATKMQIISPYQNEKPGIENQMNTLKENSSNNQNSLPEEKPGIAELKNKKENKDSTNTGINKIPPDSLSDKTGLPKIKEAMAAKKVLLPEKSSHPQLKHKWTFGIAFCGGTSAIGNAPFGNSGLSATSGANYGGLPSGNYGASPLKDGAAFLGGVFIEKNISPKNKISIGISYQYYSLINRTGNVIDTLINYPVQYLAPTGNVYSSANDENKYRNDFRFIEIPVSLKFQLGNSKTLPIYWQGGITLSQLIGSRALQFNSNLGLYYHDNSVFNKTQIGLQTGFSAIFFSKAKTPVSIGPYFIYQASKLANEGLYGGKHFSFIGIRAEILFGIK